MFNFFKQNMRQITMIPLLSFRKINLEIIQKQLCGDCYLKYFMLVLIKLHINEIRFTM